MRRWALLAILVALAIAAAYLTLVRISKVEPHLALVAPVAVIGEGDEAVGVSAGGAVLNWQQLSDPSSLPRLPLSAPPEQGRLAGPALLQARVLAAAPAALRPYIERSYYGEGGVDVELSSGIELRFGDASRIGEKWSAAAAVLADSQITALDYVNVTSPRHPAVGGSSHLLPAVE